MFGPVSLKSMESVAGDHVDDAAGHEEWRDALRALGLHPLGVIFLDGVEAADAGAHRHADARRVLGRHDDARILDGIGRCRVTVVHERIHVPQPFRRQIFLRIEVRHRAVKAHGKCAHIETSDRHDAALTFEHVAPRRIDLRADGRNDAQTSDDDASLGQTVTSQA